VSAYRGSVDEVDLLIIGSGSGNTILSPEFDGWSVALAERGRFGGTCLNAGCIPSKMLVLPADRVVEAGQAGALGVHFEPPVVDWDAVRDRVLGRIDPIAVAGLDYREHQDHVRVLHGSAQFVAPDVVDVAGARVRARRIVLAVGARPYLPPIPGLDDVPFHTTDTIMRVERLPEHLIIVGGGFVAAELGHVFAALGSRVSVVHRGGRLLRHEDHEVSVRFTEQFGRRVHLHLGAEVVSAHHAAGEVDLEVDLGDGSTRRLTGDALLVCTGRVPNADQLGLEHTDVRVNPAGYVVTDATLATDQAGVWAIGDVRNPRQLKHVANHEAAVVAHNLLHPEAPRSIDERAVPHAVFSDPQIGSVGAREEDLLATGVAYRVGRRDYAGVAYGWALGDESSFAKVLVDASTDLILGAHVIGPQAATLVQQFVTAMRFEIPAAAFAGDQLWCHPALSEVVENAVLDAAG